MGCTIERVVAHTCAHTCALSARTPPFFIRGCAPVRTASQIRYWPSKKEGCAQSVAQDLTEARACYGEPSRSSQNVGQQPPHGAFALRLQWPKSVYEKGASLDCQS